MSPAGSRRPRADESDRGGWGAACTNLVYGDPAIDVDQYGGDRVREAFDVKDLEALDKARAKNPNPPKWSSDSCTYLVHVLIERYYGAATGSFDWGHDEGLKAENELRKERGSRFERTGGQPSSGDEEYRKGKETRTETWTRDPKTGEVTGIEYSGP